MDGRNALLAVGMNGQPLPVAHGFPARMIVPGLYGYVSATMLNSASNITVFAPDNAAFAKIPPATLKKLLANKAELTKILTYHVAPARYTPAQLSSGTAIKTLEGGMVTPAAMGSTYEVNKANVVCGNVQTANATVYIIDTVLTPPAH